MKTTEVSNIPKFGLLDFWDTLLSIAFEDFLGSSIAPQVMPPWMPAIPPDHLDHGHRQQAPLVHNLSTGGTGGQRRDARFRETFLAREVAIGAAKKPVIGLR